MRIAARDRRRPLVLQASRRTLCGIPPHPQRPVPLGLVMSHNPPVSSNETHGQRPALGRGEADFSWHFGSFTVPCRPAPLEVCSA
jgi:hypothetical protein